jgi:transposase
VVGSLSVTEEYSIRQGLEILPIKPIVTEYKLRQKVCTHCSKKYKGKLSSYKLLGSNTEAIITSLSGYFNNSKREIKQILNQIFNLDVSLGLISTTEGRVSNKLAAKYSELLRQAEESSYLPF